MNRTALKYSERILRLFFFSEEPFSPELTKKVQDWLMNGEHCREKDIAMRKIFREMMDESIGNIPELTQQDRNR